MTSHLVGICISFPIPPISPQSDFGLRSYARFSEALSGWRTAGAPRQKAKSCRLSVARWWRAAPAIEPGKILHFFVKCWDFPHVFCCNLRRFLGHFPPHYTPKTPNSTQTSPHSKSPNFTLKEEETQNLH